jgi:hypothetical protein
MTNQMMQKAVRFAWLNVNLPPKEEMSVMTQSCGTSAAQAFLGIPPMEVDIESAGFHSATPLFDLPPTAAAVYLGTFLLSLLKSLEFQAQTGMFDDLLTRPHTLTFLTSERLTTRVIDRLTHGQRQALATVARYLATQQTALATTRHQVERLRAVAEIAGSAA